MKTLLQINVTANCGSTGRIAEGIGKAALQAGFRSVIAYGRRALPSTSELLPIGSKKDYMLHGIESRLLDNHGHGSRKATREFLKQVEKLSPDLIHLHNIHGYYLNYPLLFDFLAKSNIPVVWTLHDCWSFTGHCAHFDYVGCNKWLNGCYCCEQKSSYPQSIFKDRSRQNYIDKKHYFAALKNLHLVPVSSWLANLLGQSFLKDHPVNIIHNGIDAEVFCPCKNENAVRKKYNLTDKKIFLGVASVWNDLKGLGDFIALAKKLPEDIKIVLVGVSPDIAKRLPDNILAVSRTDSQRELADLYSVASAFLNPTYEDTYPTTNLEAIACGTPVVTYRTGGSPESVTARTGIVVEKGNIDALLEAALNVKKDSVLCREYALKHFMQQERFQEYIKLYENILP